MSNEITSKTGTEEDIVNFVKYVDLDELFTDLEQATPFKIVDAPNGKGKFKLEGIVSHDKLTKMYDKINLRKKGLKGQHSEANIEAATWFEACIVEPKLNFGQCLKLSEKAGFWTMKTILDLQLLSGMGKSTVDEIEGDLKSDPLESSTSTPV